jgi:formate-dependent nitrite reductase membrane component NrfD
MDTNLVLTLGIALVALTVPALFSAWADGYAPRTASVLLVLGIALIVAAVMYHPGGYRLNEVPGAVLGVLARALP